MDRLRSGFHRKSSRKNSPSRPTIITDGSLSPGKTTPEPTSQQKLQSPHVSSKKSSPFRSLRELSRSHKRARSPNPQSPVSAFSRDSPTDRPITSPHPSRKESQLSSITPQEMGYVARNFHASYTNKSPEIPSFLTLPPQEIDAKFQEIVWMERNRLMQSLTNPSPDFRWARVTGDHLKKLDRYMNIQPWENNRVKLRVPAGKQSYINASPITLSSVSPDASHVRSHNHDNDKTNGDTILGLADLAGGVPDRYIAMQGPKHKTTDHVWRMVVEQLDSPGVIVMLTETYEANMEKCYPYFPHSPDDPPLKVNIKDEFGDGFRASVRCEAIEETEAGDAIELRKLVVRLFKGPKKDSSSNGRSSGEVVSTPPTHPVDSNGDVKMLSPNKDSAEDASPTDDTEDDTGSVTVEFTRPSNDQEVSKQPSQNAESTSLNDEYEERVIWHFLYKKWPDFGVPALEDLDSFFTLMRLSREKNANPSNPRIVHCSAGVGRSGTFIALEHLMREMDAGVLENWNSPSHFRHHQDDADDAASLSGHNGHLEHKEAENGEADQKMDVGEGKNVAPIIEGDDLIFHTVNRLREQRRNMVQADSQYHFLYQVMRKLWEDRHGVSVTSAISAEPPQLPDIDYSGTNGEPAAKRLEFDPFVEQE